MQVHAQCMATLLMSYCLQQLYRLALSQIAWLMALLQAASSSGTREAVQRWPASQPDQPLPSSNRRAPAEDPLDDVKATGRSADSFCYASYACLPVSACYCSLAVPGIGSCATCQGLKPHQLCSVIKTLSKQYLPGMVGFRLAKDANPAVS